MVRKSTPSVNTAGHSSPDHIDAADAPPEVRIPSVRKKRSPVTLEEKTKKLQMLIERDKPLYAALIKRIQSALDFGQDFTLRGAKEISLYRSQTIGCERSIFRLKEASRLPFHTEGSIICLSVRAFSDYVEYERFLRTSGKPAEREMLFPEPDKMQERRRKLAEKKLQKAASASGRK